MDKKVHRKLSNLGERLNRGQMSRREFLRSVAMLGLTLTSAEVLSACGLQQSIEKPFDPIETLYGIDYITVTPYGSSGATPVPSEAENVLANKPKNILWYCGCCGETFQTIDVLQRHAVKEHAWRLPEIRQVDQPTYDQFLVGDVQRFDEKNTVFSRTAWDEEYIALVQEYQGKAPQDTVESIEGRALVAGAIYVDDTAGTLHPYYPGYFGHVRGAGGLYDWDDPVNPVKLPNPDPTWMTERIKQVARIYGADLVGICEVDERWIYSNYFERVSGEYGKLEVPYKYAVVMGIEMDWHGITESPGPGASAATALAYSKMAELSSSLAKYIRMLGYPAIPCGNDTTQSIPLAIDAGLGELGRLGLLLTPEFGPRQRLCKVLTDLPLIPDKPIDFGIQKYCETCHACAQACPVDAIRWEDRTTEQTSISNRQGILRWPVNVARCYLFWQENGVDCSNCMAACPWALHSQRDWLEL